MYCYYVTLLATLRSWFLSLIVNATIGLPGFNHFLNYNAQIPSRLAGQAMLRNDKARGSTALNTQTVVSFNRSKSLHCFINVNIGDC